MDNAMQPEDTPELRALYQGFKDNHLNPLWTQTGDLMPLHPRPKAVPHVWRWADLLPLASGLSQAGRALAGQAPLGAAV